MSTRPKSGRSTSAPKSPTTVSEKRKVKAGAKAKQQKQRRPSSESIDTTAANDTTVQSTET